MDDNDPMPADAPRVSIREVIDEDLPLLYAHQADEASATMAGMPIRDREAFDAHWARIRHDPATLLRTIVFDGQVAGNVLSFEMKGRREVGYWLDQAMWGKGIASAALAQMLAIEQRRPLYGHLLKSNLGSRRVLERNGFEYLEDDGPDDLVLILRGGPA